MIIDICVVGPDFRAPMSRVSPWLFQYPESKKTDWFEWEPYFAYWAQSYDEVEAPVPEEPMTFAQLQTYVKGLVKCLPMNLFIQVMDRYPDRLWEHEYWALKAECEEILGC